MQPLHLAIVGPVAFKTERLGQIPGSRLEQSTMDGGRGGRALRGELPHSRGSSGAERLRPRPAWNKPRRQMGPDWAGVSREITTSDGRKARARVDHASLARSSLPSFLPLRRPLVSTLEPPPLPLPPLGRLFQLSPRVRTPHMRKRIERMQVRHFTKRLIRWRACASTFPSPCAIGAIAKPGHKFHIITPH